MNKGVIFDFANEVSEYADFLQELLVGQVNDTVIQRTAVELLNSHVDCVLDHQLYASYRNNLNIESAIVGALESLGDVEIRDIDHTRISNFSHDIGCLLYRVIHDKFTDIAMQFALWHVKPVGYGIVLVEYQGDFRIMEWHDTNGVENDDSPSTVQYEFDTGHIYTFLRDRLQKYRGRYAGRIFTNTVKHLFRVVIEDFIFNPKCSYATNPLSGELIIGQYLDTEKILLDNFPLLEHKEVSGIIVDIENVISQGLRKRVSLVSEVDDILSWDLSDKQLNVEIYRPIQKVRTPTQRLKDEIQASIDNGDYVPRHLLDIANKI